MSAYVICAPSWGYTYIRNRTRPSELGIQLIELVRRDGPDAVSDMLDSHDDWDFLDAFIAIDPATAKEGTTDSTATLILEGYGKIMPRDAVSDEIDDSFTFGLLTDGTVRITARDGSAISIDPYDPGAESRLAAFCEEAAL